MLKPAARGVSYDDLFVERYVQLRQWALRLTGRDAWVADDLLHDAFVQLVVGRPDLSAVVSLDHYLYGMLRNLHLSHVRRMGRKREISLGIVEYDSAAIGLRAAGADERAQVRSDLWLTASYVMAIGRRLLMTQRLNVANPEGARVNPDFGELYFTSNGPPSDYHALQLQFQRRLSRGVQVLVNHTWAHAIDEASAENVYWELERGSADFDIRHSFSTAMTLDLPAPSKPRFRSLLRGWSADAIVLAQSAPPVSLLSGAFVTSGGLGLYARPDLVPGVPIYLDDAAVPGGRRFNPDAFQAPPEDPETGFARRQGTLGRNSLRGLSMWQVNLALRRQFDLGARRRRTECAVSERRSALASVLDQGAVLKSRLK